MIFRLSIMILSALALSSCGTAKDSAKNTERPDNRSVSTAPVAPVRATGTNTLAARPRAVLFRTNGDYADNVMIRLDGNGNLLYYPAVSDISAGSSSLPVGNGWYLDRQGAALSGTAFLKYTYAEYAALPVTPSPAELKAAIIPGARVTETQVLPVSPAEAEADPGALKKYLNPKQQTINPQAVTIKE